MPRLFVANVTFEHELSPHRHTLPKRLLRLGSELAGMWLAVAEEGDWIWCPEPVEAGFWPRMEELGVPRIHVCGPSSPPPPGLELAPWGWSNSVRALSETAQARVSGPPQNVIELINSRAYSSAMETEWGSGLDGGAVIATAEDLESALASRPPSGRWVIKSELGAAARERILGNGRRPSLQVVSWMRARLARGDRLFFEPWVERVSEAGLQWDIPEAGPPMLLGVTELLCDRRGNYAGSRFRSNDAAEHDWGDAIEPSRRAAARIQQAGYFGPLGIDAMRYRGAGGEIRLRPLQDINARWTMGRIALGWRRVAPRGTWRHGAPSELAGSSGRRIIETSPRFVGGSAVEHCTWIEVE